MSQLYPQKTKALRTCKRCGKEELVYVSYADRPYCGSVCYHAARREQPKAGRDPEKRQASRRRNKAKRRGAFIDYTLDALEWRRIVADYGGRCAYCGNKSDDLTQDHIIPISKGGEHVAANVVPACMFCNQSKRDKAWTPKRPRDWDTARDALE